MITKGAKLAGKHLLTSGLDIAQDLIEGKSFAESAKQNFKTNGKALLGTLSNALKNSKPNTKRGVAKRKVSPPTNKHKIKRRRVDTDIFA